MRDLLATFAIILSIAPVPAANAVAGARITAPPPPTQVRTAVVGGGVRITWRRPAAPVTSFRIYRSTAPGFLGERIRAVWGRGTSYVDPRAKAGITYAYTVRSFRRGWGESQNRNAVAVRIPSGDRPGGAIPPAPGKPPIGAESSPSPASPKGGTTAGTTSRTGFDLSSMTVTRVTASEANARDRRLITRSHNPASVVWRYRQTALVTPPEMHENGVRFLLYGHQNCIDGIAEYLGIPFPHDELVVTYDRDPVQAATGVRYASWNEVVNPYADDQVAAWSSPSVFLPKSGITEVGHCFDGHEVTHVFMSALFIDHNLNEGIASYMGAQRRSSAVKEHHRGELDVEAENCLPEGLVIGRTDGVPTIQPYVNLSSGRPAENGHSGTVYETGACLWQHIDQRLGHDAFLRVLQNLAAHRKVHIWDCPVAFRERGAERRLIYVAALGEEAVRLIEQRFRPIFSLPTFCIPTSERPPE